MRQGAQSDRSEPISPGGTVFPDRLRLATLRKGSSMRSAQLHLLVSSTLLTTYPAIAQTAPGSAPAGGTGSISWLWIILLVVVIGAAIWYFGFARNRSHTTNSTGVDRDRVAGSVKQAKGAVEEGAGKVLGDAKLQAEGRMDKAEGKAQNTLGGIKDTLRGE